jgi:predicted esterase
VIARTIDTLTHGRYLIESAAASEPVRVLVGFHGYSENADAQLDRLRRSPGAPRWHLVSIQALNRFYQRRSDEVVASWMTRQDRELAIADNIAYVARVVDAIAGELGDPSALVFSGFSQGVAMAFRAAAASTRRVSAVVAVAGDVPPELSDIDLRRCGRILLCHGVADDWYTPEKFAADRDRLKSAKAETHALEFDAGHEWSAAIVQAVDTFLSEV